MYSIYIHYLRVMAVIPRMTSFLPLRFDPHTKSTRTQIQVNSSTVALVAPFVSDAIRYRYRYDGVNFRENTEPHDLLRALFELVQLLHSYSDS